MRSRLGPHFFSCSQLGTRICSCSRLDPQSCWRPGPSPSPRLLVLPTWRPCLFVLPMREHQMPARRRRARPPAEQINWTMAGAQEAGPTGTKRGSAAYSSMGQVGSALVHTYMGAQSGAEEDMEAKLSWDHKKPGRRGRARPPATRWAKSGAPD